MKVPFLKSSAALAASVLALGLSTNAMSANLPFTVSPGFVSPTLTPLTFKADTLAGVSTELLTVTASGTSGAGYLLFTAATLNGTPQFTGFAQSGNPAPGQYNLYLKFQLSDNGFGTVGVTNQLTLLNFQVFLDQQNNDTFTPAGFIGGVGTNATVSGSGDDTMLAFGTLTGPAAGNVDGFDSGGGVFANSTETFNICSGAGTAKYGSTNVAATNATFGTNGLGCSSNELGFFVSPSPFYSLAFDGFNNNGSPANVQKSGNQIAIISAVGNVAFATVPEPGTIALFGIAAAAAGLASRRRKS